MIAAGGVRLHEGSIPHLWGWWLRLSQGVGEVAGAVLFGVSVAHNSSGTFSYGVRDLTIDGLNVAAGTGCSASPINVNLASAATTTPMVGRVTGNTGATTSRARHAATDRRRRRAVPRGGVRLHPREGARAGPVGRRLAFLKQQFAAQDAHYRGNYPGATVDVVEVDGERAGRLYVHRGARDIRIMDIALLAPFRGQGVGTALIGALIDRPRAAPASCRSTSRSTTRPGRSTSASHFSRWASTGSTC